MLKRIVIMFCMFFIIVLNIKNLMADEKISINFNNNKLKTDVDPVIIEGRTLVPLRVIFEALGIKVEWNDETKTIIGTKKDKTIKIEIDNINGLINNEKVTLSVPPKIVDGRTLVPIRFISESVGAEVKWNDKERKVDISYIDDNEIIFNEIDGVKLNSKISGKNFMVYTKNGWKNKIIKGVNIGAGKPGHFPGELAITKDEYLRWFKYISDMNAEVIRVYTTMKPAFYDALYEYNTHNNNKLYLLQGVWIDEGKIHKYNDAYGGNNIIKDEFIKDAKDLVDIIHGKANLKERAGFASGKYENNISQYVIGWIMGIEWDPEFVHNTIVNNPSIQDFNGKYLKSEGATPFEVFLGKSADEVIEYEISNYKTMRALSFTNWLTTDMLEHKNEPFQMEDFVSVNIENIMPNKNFESGIFASYHIYPYYPDFLHYQKEYIEYKDENGKTNTYKAYLKDLIAKYSIPVLVAEFGIPASRGMAHIEKYSGFNQGNHSEQEQGRMISSLYNDIISSGYCGGLVFSWQDEWFKRTWNTAYLDLPDTRPYWSNPQTNEQQFGLLAFDPGEKKSICYVDGEIDDWEKDNPLIENSDGKLCVKSDEKYLYFLIKSKSFNKKSDTIYIPIDTIKTQGSNESKSEEVKFKYDSDFLIKIADDENSKVLIDSKYDTFYFMYGIKQKQIPLDEFHHSSIGQFDPINLCLGRKTFLPLDKVEVPFTQYETGKLKYGNANPMSKDFNSLTDISEKNGNIEIRIPWQLLNVMDPSTKTIMDDLYKKNEIVGMKSDGFNIGFGFKNPNGKTEINEMKNYDWEGWNLPKYHERLKSSYYIVQETFKEK